jgi:hypothetical protein
MLIDLRHHRTVRAGAQSSSETVHLDSWLNMVERFFRDLSENQLRRAAFHSVPELILVVSVKRIQTDCILFSLALARVTFARMSEAFACL